MSWRSNARYSPYGAPASRNTTVTDNDYEYVDPDEYELPRGQRQAPISDGYGFPKPTRIIHDDLSSPDILILKHRGRTYPLHFPAYCIGEGELRVGELRKEAAQKTACDPRQIKLLYKGSVLKDDSKTCREMGLKQNSELMCVISESPVMSRPGDESSESADEEDMANGVRLERTPSRNVNDSSRPKKSRKNHRGGATKKRDGHANGSSGTSTPRSSNSNLLSSDGPRPSSSSSTTTSSSSRPTPTSPPQPTSTPTPPAPPSHSGPRTALSTIEEISSNFHVQYVPTCIKFISNPPTDAKTREFEYKKLSESILAQVILKLDGVETGGDDVARSRRKALVKETQDLLARLDAVGKR
ncbi:MAG: hypothetical protein MMC33_003107 [Icmadophila ericetorum]|nr:hypothetical protein [Icmadophila ericetorum]